MKQAIIDILKLTCAIVGYIVLILMFIYACWLAIDEDIYIDPSNPQTSVGIDTSIGLNS